MPKVNSTFVMRKRYIMNTNKEYTYNHYAKPADVWKHQVLCEALFNEQTTVYVETNSACASYTLNHTPE